MTDGTSLAVATSGRGEPVLWLPGGPGLDNYLSGVAARLPGWRHVLPDPRGTGLSQGGPHGLDVALSDLEDLRTAFEITSWTVVGHSWGADLALAYGLEHTDAVTSIISFAGTGVQNDRDWHAAYEARLGEEPHGTYQHSPEVQRALLQDWRRYLRAPDLLARIAELDVSVTFLQAGHDIRPGWPAQQLARLTPRGRYLELAGAPHEAWLTHSDELTATLRHLLAATPR